MKTPFKANVAKALIGTVAAGAMAVSAASPAAARTGGIGAGEVIAGALVIGGIAAIATAASRSNGNDYRYDSNYSYGRAGFTPVNARSGWGMNPRQAVEQCVHAAQARANRVSWGGRAQVTDIRDVRQTRNGFEVRGRVAVNTMGRGWNRQDANYGRGWNGDHRGWNANLRGYDSGNFTCQIRNGGVSRLNFSGIRGL